MLSRILSAASRKASHPGLQPACDPMNRNKGLLLERQDLQAPALLFESSQESVLLPLHPGVDHVAKLNVKRNRTEVPAEILSQGISLRQKPRFLSTKWAMILRSPADNEN